jgi:uncharacterized membrane protein
MMMMMNASTRVTGLRLGGSCGRHRCVGITNNRYTTTTCMVYKNENDSVVEQEKSASVGNRVALVGMLSALLVMGDALVGPEEAFAARSGGRVGGSSFSSRRQAAPRAVPRSGGGSVRNYNYYSAPPLVSPYGFGMPFFGGGIVAPFPFFGLGSFFNIILLMFMVNVAFNVISSFTNGSSGRRRDEDEDDERW